MNRMKMMCALAVACAFAVGANAATKGKAGTTKTLTGCLQKGSEPGTYTLTDVSGGPAADNKEWELIGAPATLKLDEHVGHKVSITGSVVGAGAAMKIEHKTATTSATDTGKTETTKTTMAAEEKMERHLKVRSMKHIAATCP